MAEQENQVVVEQTNEIKGEQLAKDFSEFARLLNTSVDGLKEEFYLFQIKKIMSRMQKAILRHDLTSESLEKMFANAEKYGLSGICLAPAYLPRCVKYISKAKTFSPALSSIIDFPFGESLIKTKVGGIKENVKKGATSIMVAMQSTLLKQENIKEFKKQCKKIYGANKKIPKGLIFDAKEINKDNYLAMTKALKKIKISSITLSFGDDGLEEIKQKLEVIKEIKKDKKLFVLANVDKIEDVVELCSLGADMVITSFADQIGEELLKRFGLIK